MAANDTVAICTKGVASSNDRANYKTTDPSVAAKPNENSNESSPTGEKRTVATSGLAEGGERRRAKSFKLSFDGTPKAGAVSMVQDKRSKEGGELKINLKTTEVAKPMKLVSIKLSQKPKEPELKVPMSHTVAHAFADDSDEEEETMPPEAKMRMKNVGRDTITSAGPNSFNKSRIGFNDHARVWKRKMEEQNATSSKK